MCQIPTNSHIGESRGCEFTNCRQTTLQNWEGCEGEGEEGEGKNLRSQGLHTNHNFGSMQAWTHSSLNISFFRETILHHLVPDKGSNSLIAGHFGRFIHLAIRSPFVRSLFNYMLGHIISNRLRRFES